MANETLADVQQPREPDIPILGVGPTTRAVESQMPQESPPPAWHPQHAEVDEQGQETRASHARRFGHFMKKAAEAQVPFEHVEPALKKQFGVDTSSLKKPYEDEIGLSKARDYVSGATGEDWMSYVDRHMGYGSIAHNIRFGKALKRLNEGEATPEDYQTIAVEEKLGEIDKKRPAAWKMVADLAGLPRMGAEMMIGGRAVGQLAKIPGVSRLVTGVGEAAAGQGAKALAARGLSAATSTAAQTAAMPGMWAPEWTQNNIQAGRDPLDLRGAPPAFAMGALSTAILGRVAGKAGTIEGRVLGGMAEQQVADVLGSAAGLQTGYGLLGDLAKDDRKEGLQKVATQVLTFAAFAGAHDAPELKRAILDGFSNALKKAKRQGLSEAGATKAVEEWMSKDEFMAKLEAMRQREGTKSTNPEIDVNDEHNVLEAPGPVSTNTPQDSETTLGNRYPNVEGLPRDLNELEQLQAANMMRGGMHPKSAGDAIRAERLKRQGVETLGQKTMPDISLQHGPPAERPAPQFADPEMQALWEKQKAGVSQGGSGIDMDLLEQQARAGNRLSRLVGAKPEKPRTNAERPSAKEAQASPQPRPEAKPEPGPQNGSETPPERSQGPQKAPKQLTNEQAASFLGNHFGSWLQSLPQTSKAALQAWKNTRRVNIWLRGEMAGGQWEVQNRHALDAAIRTAPALPTPMVLTRGISAYPHEKAAREFVESLKPGARFSDAGYVATSASGEYEPLGEKQEHAVKFEIHVPAGTHAAYVPPLEGKNTLEHEHELLLPRRGTYTVRSVEPMGANNKRVILEYSAEPPRLNDPKTMVMSSAQTPKERGPSEAPERTPTKAESAEASQFRMDVSKQAKEELDAAFKKHGIKVSDKDKRTLMALVEGQEMAEHGRNEGVTKQAIDNRLERLQEKADALPEGKIKDRMNELLARAGVRRKKGDLAEPQGEVAHGELGEGGGRDNRTRREKELDAQADEWLRAHEEEKTNAERQAVRSGESQQNIAAASRAGEEVGLQDAQKEALAADSRAAPGGVPQGGTSAAPSGPGNAPQPTGGPGQQPGPPGAKPLGAEEQGRVSGAPNLMAMPGQKPPSPPTTGPAAPQPAPINVPHLVDTVKGIIRRLGAAFSRKGGIASRDLSEGVHYMHDWIVREPDEAVRAQHFIDVSRAIETQDEPTRLKHRAALPKQVREWVDVMRAQNDALEPEMRRLKIIDNFIENYMGHLWEKPDDPNASAGEIAAQMASRQSLAGKEGFRKQRSIPTYEDGIAAGLKPKSWNPIELHLLKLNEANKSIFGRDVFEQSKAAGALRFFRLGGTLPKGWSFFDEKLAKVFAAPEVEQKQWVDKQQMEGLESFAKSLGIDVSTTSKGPLGMQTPGKVSTRFGTPEEVLAHEIGHELDRQFGLDKWAKNPSLRPELIQLADLRASGRVDPAHRDYLRSDPELIANLVAAYVHAPELLQKVAPNAHQLLESFLQSNAKVRPLMDIKPSLELDERQQMMRVAGPMLVGNYAGPNEVVNAFNNYLSPGLGDYKAYRIFRNIGNNVNMFNLGASAFHATGTAMRAQWTSIATGLKELSRGNLGGLAPLGRGLVPLLPSLKYMHEGFDGRKEWYQPGSTRPEIMEGIANIVRSGGRVHLDSLEKTDHLNAMRTALQDLIDPRSPLSLRAKGGSMLALRWVPAMFEMLNKPTMEHMVPSIKLGAAMEAMRYEAEHMHRQGIPMTEANMTERFGKVWDSMDNRMGQLVYDNLFWHKSFRDAAMAAVRAVGWNVGTWRELGGAIKDIPSSAKGLRSGEGISERAAYAIATTFGTAIMGAMTQYLLTGKGPDELKDYIYPKNGRKAKDGTDERLQFPDYPAHDVAPMFKRADEGPWRLGENAMDAVQNKLHPAMVESYRAIRGTDWQGANIRNYNDPVVKQTQDTFKYLFDKVLPISYQNWKKASDNKQSLSDQMGGFVGVTDASSAMRHTSEEMRKQEMKRVVELTPLHKKIKNEKREEKKNAQKATSR